MPKTILSIDCGTQSLRAIIFSVKGEILASEKVIFKQAYYSERPGWAEQDAEVYWKALKKACSQLKEESPNHFTNIAGIGLTTLRNTFVNVDDSGNPLRPLILWLDQRKAKPVYNPWFGMKLAIWFVGMWVSVKKAQREGKCNWIKQNQPEIWKKTHKYLQVSGFLNYRLTGKFKDSVASQIGHIPFDYRRQKWGSGKRLFTFSPKIFRIEKEKLPELVDPGKVIGEITKTASEDTGLKSGIPVIACGSDKGCGTLGMGVVSNHEANLCFGTTATIQSTSKKYIEPISFMPSYPAVIPGYFNPEIEIFRGFWMISWFKNEFAQREVELAKDKGVSAEEVLNELLIQSPPGAMGLIVQPFWSPGLSEPTAKGAMIGFGDVHRKPHIYRAVIEGLAFALLDGKHKIERASKNKIRSVTVSGGASQSDEICQIAANVFNLPMLRGETWETSALGAAIIVAHAIGEYPGLEAAVSKMVRFKKKFLPDPKTVEIYQKLYKKVYRKIYKKLRPLYMQIQEITNYPEK